MSTECPIYQDQTSLTLKTKLYDALTDPEDSYSERAFWSMQLTLQAIEKALQNRDYSKTARFAKAVENVVDSIRTDGIKYAAQVFWTNYQTPTHYIDTGVPVGCYADPSYRITEAIKQVHTAYIEQEFMLLELEDPTTEEAREWIHEHEFEPHPNMDDEYNLMQHKEEADLLSAYLWFTAPDGKDNKQDVHQAWQTVAEWRLQFDAPVFWPEESEHQNHMNEFGINFNSEELIDELMCQRVVRHLNALWI